MPILVLDQWGALELLRKAPIKFMSIMDYLGYRSQDHSTGTPQARQSSKSWVPWAVLQVLKSRNNLGEWRGITEQSNSVHSGLSPTLEHVVLRDQAYQSQALSDWLPCRRTKWFLPFRRTCFSRIEGSYRLRTTRLQGRSSGLTPSLGRMLVFYDGC